jgi:hypothetical protein
MPAAVARAVASARSSTPSAMWCTPGFVSPSTSGCPGGTTASALRPMLKTARVPAAEARSLRGNASWRSNTDDTAAASADTRAT